MSRWATIRVLFLLMMGCGAASAQTLSVADSVHNLSLGTTNPGGCGFCHAPHNTAAAQPLWNHQATPNSVNYTPYTSSTFKQLNEPVTDRSKRCLSCHDGTIALGQTIAFGPLQTSSTLSSRTNLGTNFATDHPFGFTMPAMDDGEIRLTLTTAPPATADPAVKLHANKIECITCHDPHTPNRDNVVKKFLVRDNANGALCSACHDATRGSHAGWNLSSHATATNSVALALSAYGTVAQNACANCHTSHNAAGTGPRLLRGTEEASCAACHSPNSNVAPAAPNVMDQFTKSRYTHPTVTVKDVHDPAETLPITNARHAECADCHNSHASQSGAAATLRPASAPSLLGSSGVSASNGTSVVQPALNQYEICFKCHADSTNKPQSTAFADYGRTPYRQTFTATGDPYNVRLDLQSPLARHNVTQPAGARGAISPSLRTNMLDLLGNPTGASLAAGTYIYCTDCHSNDNARNSGGTAPSGPHGSNWIHLLERRYEMNDLPAGGAGSQYPSIPYLAGISGPYALCEKCHDVAGKIMQGDTVFGQHQRHVQNEGASCSTCHAPHGIQGGTARNNQRLINFDKSIVGPDSQGRLYIDTVNRTCYLRCHGEDHNGEHY